MSKGGRCAGCKKNVYEMGEYCMLQDDVWMSAAHTPDGHLCVGCVEQRIGRELTTADFIHCRLNESQRMRGSERLRDRLGPSLDPVMKAEVLKRDLAIALRRNRWRKQR